MRVLLACGLGCMLAAGVAGGGDAKTDAKLDGKWVGELKGMKIVMTFAKDKFTFDFDGQAEFKGTVKIDAKKKPREMDLKITEGPMFEGETTLCIYELDGDTLKWSAAEPGSADRPKSFKDGEEKHMSIVFKRAK